MKIGWKIRKLWHFEVSQIFTNISWPVDMNMQMSELMMSSPHYLPYILYIKFWKIQYFAHTCDSTCMSLISSCIGVNIILHLFRKKLRQVEHSHSWNMKFLSFLCTKWMGNCEAMTSTRSFAYSYQLVKKCFLKICETSKCHNFLIFQPIFIRFSLFYSQIFTLSYEIKLNLFRISPLTCT